MSDTWSKWIQKVDIYMLATNRQGEPDNIKIAILLNLIGDEGVTLFNTFKHVKDEKYSEVLDMFEKHFKPKKNIVYERFKFYKSTQEKGQTLNKFITELKRLAATCEFHDESNMIRDKIVLEVHEDALREKLLAEVKLTLEKAIEMCNNHEVRRKQANEMSRHNEKEIDVIKSKSFPNKWKKNEMSKEKERKKELYKCKRCGREHAKRECPAFGKKCAKCSGIGHFAVSCRSKSYKIEDRANKGKKNWENNLLEVDKGVEDEYYIDNITCSDAEKNEWHQVVNIKGKWIKFKLDSGAECNVIPEYIYRNIKDKEDEIKDTDIGLITYSGHKIKPSGTAIIKSKIKDMTVNIKYVIADVKSKPILGLKTCMKLNLIKRVSAVETSKKKVFKNRDEVMKNYANVFTGLGCFPGKKYSMKLKEGARAVAKPSRRVARSLLPKLKETLDKLTKAKVIKVVNEPTEWLHPIVIKEKPNKSLRICLDPKDLNEALKEERYQLPTQDEILSELNGKELFSTLDLRDGFYQVELDDESAMMCVFGTPFDRYQFLRMPFGIKTAAEVFQKKNMEIFGNIPNVKVYIDDIFIAGNEADHDETLVKVLEAAQTAGITFNKDKFQYKKKEIKLLGHVITSEGIRIDPERTQAIKGMETPKNRSELLRFLGMTKYVCQFLPNLSKVSKPLRELSKEKNEWKWTQEHSSAMELIKKLLTNAEALRHYDPSRELVIQTDSSKDGLGSVLMQDGRPIAYASRALTKSEINFAQIEKELLAICFAAERFHYYVYGKTVKVLTDHKPLVSISRKNMDKVPTRLQRMLLRLFKYNLKIEYLKGSEMLIADTLSRAYLQGTNKEDNELNYVIHEMKRELPMSERRRRQFVEATKSDTVLNQIMEYIKNGWPHEKKIRSDMRNFMSIKEELSNENGIIVYGDKIVVPESLRSDMIKILHEEHQGIVKSKLKARQIMYWPGMSKDIENKIANCTICQLHRNNNPRQPLHQHEIPERPWEKVAMDVATWKGKDYLVIIDYFSKWIEVKKLIRKTASEVIKQTKNVFSVHGLPDIIMSDNMPFNSDEFKAYLLVYDIKGITSSPNYPRSNGLAEKAVGLVKKMLSKCEMTGGHLSDHLLNYRSTPIPGILFSPAQLLFSRQIKNKLPGLNSHYTPKKYEGEMIRERMKVKQENQKKYYDRGVRRLKEVEVGDEVLIKTNRRWKKGKVIAQHESPRSHIISEGGKAMRRNREQMVWISKGDDQKVQEAKQEGAEGNNPGKGSPEKEESCNYNFRDRTLIKRPSRYDC